MIEIIPSLSLHCLELSKNLRQKDKKEIISLGLDPRRAIFYAYRNAILRRTALLDDQVVAMWGVVGTPLGITGTPYLLTSPLVYRINPVRFARIYLQEVTVMQKLFPVLENYVDTSYEEAVRMLVLAGFNIEESLDMNDTKFLRFTRHG